MGPVAPVLDSGSTLPSFLSTTSDSRTACRASARCSSEPTCAVSERSARPLLANGAHLALDRQHATDGVVEARLRHGAVVISDRSTAIMSVRMGTRAQKS